jgi:uncharacterized protein YwqG
MSADQELLNLNERILELRKKYGKPASIFELDVEKTPTQTGSRFGGKPMGLSTESWPISEDGDPMRFIAQFNLSELPVVPNELSDIALISIFIEYQNEGNTITHEMSRQRIRTYSQMDNLVEVDFPKNYLWKSAPITTGSWAEVIDVESLWNDEFLEVYEMYLEVIENQKKRSYEHMDILNGSFPGFVFKNPINPMLEWKGMEAIYGVSLSDDSKAIYRTLGHHILTKIGGYDSQIGYLMVGNMYTRHDDNNEWEPGVDPEWVMQIASEPLAEIEWDGFYEMMHISRGTAEGKKDRWYINGEYN